MTPQGHEETFRRPRKEIELDDVGPVREHYASESVAARVLTALRNVNRPEVPITPDTLAD